MRSVPKSVMTGPLSQAGLAVLFPSEVRAYVFRAARSNDGDANGDMAWAAVVWVPVFLVLLAAIFLVGLVFPALPTDSVFHFVTTWLLGLPLAGAAWCLVRHFASGGSAIPNLLDDAAIVLIALLMALLL